MGKCRFSIKMLCGLNRITEINSLVDRSAVSIMAFLLCSEAQEQQVVASSQARTSQCLPHSWGGCLCVGGASTLAGRAPRLCAFCLMFTQGKQAPGTYRRFTCFCVLATLLQVLQGNFSYHKHELRWSLTLSSWEGRDVKRLQKEELGS